MLGAILGDIIGSRWEFNPTNDYNFELFSDKNEFTDDTLCTIGVADALQNNSNDFGKYIQKWCRKYSHPMGGYGGRFARWVESDYPQPYNSFGNGSAMRVSPVAYYFNTIDDVLDTAEKQAGCSHNHPEGIKGSQTVALASSYEDAVRMAISLGADADTLGAIVGGIAETIWGMPSELRHKVMDFLPEDMGA